MIFNYKGSDLELTFESVLDLFQQDDEFEQYNYEPGQIAYIQGNKPHGLYILMKGRVKFSTVCEDGQKRITKVRFPDSVLNHSDLLSNSVNSYTCEALSQVQILFIPKRNFFLLLEKHEELFLYLNQVSHDEIRSLERRNYELSFIPVRGRLINLILNMSHNNSENGKEREIMALSRFDISCLLGTAKETINRIISELKNEGLIEISGSSISILRYDILVKDKNLYH